MKVTKTSIYSGITRTREIDIDIKQLNMWLRREASIQDAMPNLSPDDREFLMTGITPDEWDRMFNEKETN